MNHDVFISYSSRNQVTATAVCHVLESHGIRCWMAPRDLPPGSDYGDLIDAAIEACRVFVIVFSEPASLSMWVRGELNAAFSQQKYIIPYRIDPTPLKGAMRVILNQMHWVDAYPDAESKFGELAATIARMLGATSRTSQPVAGPLPVQAAAAVSASGASAPAERPASRSNDMPGADAAPRPRPAIGRNDPCPCGSGKKYKNCHGRGL